MCFVFLLVPFCKYEPSWYIFSYPKKIHFKYIDEYVSVSMCIYVSSFFHQRYRPTLEIFSENGPWKNLRQQKVLSLPRPRRWMCFCVRDSPEGDVFFWGDRGGNFGTWNLRERSKWYVCIWLMLFFILQFLWINDYVLGCDCWLYAVTSEFLFTVVWFCSVRDRG